MLSNSSAVFCLSCRHVAIWEKTVTSRDLQLKTKALLERGYAAVHGGRMDTQTADTLEACIREATELASSGGESLKGAIATWERTLAKMRPNGSASIVKDPNGRLKLPGTNSPRTTRAGSRTRAPITWTERDCVFDIERDMAEKSLRHRTLDTGAFIVRKSSSFVGQYTLSVRLMDVIKHYRLNMTEDGKYLMRGSDKTFATMTKLLQNYTRSDKNDALSTVLTDPCPRKIIDSQLAVTAQRLCDSCGRCGKPIDAFCQFCGIKYTGPMAPLPEVVVVKADSWELRRDNVQLLGVLGAGNFGEVRQGLLGGTKDVAIKTSKADKMSTKTFLEEAQKMKKLLHGNLVRLWGVCTMADPVLMVLEYVGGGCLLDWLHSRRARSITMQHQCKFLADVSSGMEFMQDRHWVHGDLAARNILVSSSGTTLKICDFGHAVRCNVDDVPVAVKQQLPVRWCAPEFFRSRKCNPAVDVWSFGIVAFEVLTKAMEPYADIPENKEVVARLESGWRMPRLREVPIPFYNMMKDCWTKEPLDRPRFSHIHTLCQEWAMKGAKHTAKGELVDKEGKALVYKTGITCGTKVPTPPDPQVQRPDRARKKQSKSKRADAAPK